MKTAIFKDGDVTQIVLTPETAIDNEIHNMLSSLVNVKMNPLGVEHDEITPIECKIMKGSFYACRGGWTKQGEGSESIIFQF